MITPETCNYATNLWNGIPFTILTLSFYLNNKSLHQIIEAFPKKQQQRQCNFTYLCKMLLFLAVEINKFYSNCIILRYFISSAGTNITMEPQITKDFHIKLHLKIVHSGQATKQ